MSTPYRADHLTGYMQRAASHLAALPAGAKILDLPAGGGYLTDELRRRGYWVISADIDRARDDYVYADMTQRLPFADNTFEGVVCLEGIEHVLNPFLLIGELIRVARAGGRIVLSTPNIMNMYSRLQFLFTGTFHQFHPALLEEVAPGEVRDRFHVSPLSYPTLRYLGDYFGADVVHIDGDKVKRLVFMPLYLVVLVLGRIWSYRLFFSPCYRTHRERNRQLFREINSRPTLFSRSLVLVFEKRRPARQPSAIAA
jgi:SAM-dependent methyltransferase